MFRRDWREQALVLAMLTIAVAVSSYAAALGHALAPSDQASFGSATARVQFTARAGQEAATVATARAFLGPVEEITDWSVPIPGSIRRLDLRTQNPRAPLGAPLLQLVSGRYPTAGREITLTPSISQFLGASVGSRVRLAGTSWQVVGLVEDPAAVNDDFALVTGVSPGTQVQVTLLANATAAQLAAFRQTPAADGGQVLIATPIHYSHDLGVLLVAALAMILVSVLSGTAFLVLAQRRIRHLGMLSAVGATRRQVRNVTIFHGLIVAGIAATVGTALAAGTWALTSTLLAHASGRRETWNSVPAWLILSPAVMALVASTVAAWWPARAMARVPVVRALSNRPPDTTPGRRSVTVAAIALLVGAICLHYAHQRNAVLMIVGLAAMIAGILATAPLLVRVATGRGSRLPVAARIAWRDLGRNHGRAAAALASITMAVGASAAAVVITAANTHPAAAGNLSDRQLLIHLGTADNSLVPRFTRAQLDDLNRGIARVAAAVSSATVVPLDVAVDPRATPSPTAVAHGDLQAVQVVQQQGQQLSSYPLYIAAPPLLAGLGANPSVSPEPELSARNPTGSWSMLDSRRTPLPAPATMQASAYTSLPQVLASPAMLTARHWQSARAGWLIETRTPLTPQQVRTARAQAAALGVAIETRDPQAYLGTLRLVFTVAGTLVTLAIITIALVLLRTQTTRDRQILTAVGANRHTRRTMTATTATGLAGLGALLGITGAYLTLVLAYSDTPGRLSNIPVSALFAIAVGIPSLALLGSWLTGQRQHQVDTRPVID